MPLAPRDSQRGNFTHLRREASAMATRTETDTFGPIEVDSAVYWGAQAQRSLGNFKIGWEKQPAPVIHALGTHARRPR